MRVRHPRLNALVAAAAMASLFAAAAPAAQQDKPLRNPDVVYVPTPQEVVDATAFGWPLRSLGQLKSGRYRVQAMIKLRVGDEVMHTAAEGSGPVALRENIALADESFQGVEVFRLA